MIVGITALPHCARIGEAIHVERVVGDWYGWNVVGDHSRSKSG
jgi:hypothetical protein